MWGRCIVMVAVLASLFGVVVVVGVVVFVVVVVCRLSERLGVPGGG